MKRMREVVAGDVGIDGIPRSIVRTRARRTIQGRSTRRRRPLVQHPGLLRRAERASSRYPTKKTTTITNKDAPNHRLVFSGAGHSLPFSRQNAHCQRFKRSITQSALHIMYLCCATSKYDQALRERYNSNL